MATIVKGKERRGNPRTDALIIKPGQERVCADVDCLTGVDDVQQAIKTSFGSFGDELKVSASETNDKRLKMTLVQLSECHIMELLLPSKTGCWTRAGH